MALTRIPGSFLDQLSNVTFANITASGNLYSHNANLGNLAIANYFSGSGANLSNIQAANIVGTVATANYAAFAGNITIAAQANITTVGTLGNLDVTSNVTAGNIKTDHLLYANGSPYVFTTNAAGSNTQIQFNDGNSFAGSANLTFDKTSNTLTVDYFLGDGSNVANVNAVSLNGHSDTYFASTTYVDNAVANLVASAPAALDTLNELANALGNDASFSTSITNSLANKLSISAFNSTANTWLATQTTSNLSEGTNQYFTEARANTAIDNRVTQSFVNNLAVTSNIANTAYSVAAANVTGLGNLALVNKDGNASNILYGNGVFASAPVTYGNSNVSAYLPNYTGNIGASSISVTGTLSLSNIASLYVPGGSANYILKTDGSGTLSWVAPTSGGNANINGSNTQIFFNDANSTALGASANLTFNKSTNTLTTTNMVVSGTTNLGSVSNITVTGGSSNNFLKTDGSGTLSWASLPTTSVTVDAYTGNGVQVAYTLSATPTNANYTIVAVAGVMQPKSTYSVSGNVLTFTGAPPNSAPVEVTTINSGVSMPSGGGGSGTGLTYQGISANTTLVAGNAYIVNTSSANLTLTLPASSTLGDLIGIIDGTGDANSHEITVTGANIMGSNNDMVVNTSRAAFQIVYYNSTQGWLLTSV